MNENDKPRRLDAYVRVSEVRGRAGETFISPDTQKDKIRDWARYKGHEIAEYHEELDVSGRKANRPVLDEVMRRIRDGESDGVVVWKCSRFGRNLLNSLMLIKEINECGAMFASATEDFDTSTRMGNLVMGIMLLLAEDESEGIKESWANAAERALDRKAAPQGTPFGYQRPCRKCGTATVTRNQRAVCPKCGEPGGGPLEPHPIEGPIVTELFRRRAAGEPWRSIVRWISESGVAPKRGSGWSQSSLTNTIKVRTYLGHLTRNGKVYENTHPALVDEMTWRQANRSRPTFNKGGANPRLLSGIVRCAGCRYAMRPHPFAYVDGYRCMRHSVGADCSAPASIIAGPGGRLVADTGDRHRGRGKAISRVRELLADGAAMTMDQLIEKSGLDKQSVRKARAELSLVDAGPDPNWNGRKGRKPRLWRLPTEEAAPPPGLDAYVVDETFKHLHWIHRESREAGVDMESLRVQARAANERRMEFAADTEILKTAGREAYMAGLESLQAEEDAAKAALAKADREHPLLDRPVAELEEDFRQRMTLSEQREFLSNVVQAVFVRDEPGRKSKGKRIHGASAETVRIVFADEPPVDIPRKGYQRYVLRPFPFGDDPDSPVGLGEPLTSPA